MAGKTNIIGIGIGPFNLGLAALLSTVRDIQSVFLEKKPEFHWHHGLLLPGTTLQVPFFADLVTMADPSHKLSYLSYLHQHNRLYQFYYYEDFQIPRIEYNHYCRWAANQLQNCHFGENVTQVIYDEEKDSFNIHSELASGQIKQYTSPNIAIGIGTTPNIPKWLESCHHPLVKHASEFAQLQEKLTQCQNVTIIGSGQSAAECVLALFRLLTPEQVENGASIRWITQSAGYHPMEYSKLGQECFTPSYMSYFQDLSREQRRKIAAGQGLLFKGISCSTIADIYDLLYERSIGGRHSGLYLNPNCQVNSIEDTSQSSKLNIKCRHTQLDQNFTIETNAVIAAVGYVHKWPKWLEQLKGSVLAVDSNNDFIVQKDFTAQRCDKGLGKIFIQNAEIFQQSVASPDLGVGASRNGAIINQLAKREIYRLQKNTSFQQYGIPEGAILDS
ncbi:putative histamine N-monooxygenase [Marinomonas rhizomae]|uniref:Lysine N6-hydroxylase n=1 Tax=Marinomonas rhizomae TaxID=491948 RepID=A0A366JHI5_9GAMM|nr:putative histamine N-monooxygenase [Marinomonas rhizomae]RBP85785.1 lysine N6-hydroxylase [Marinomonas rhizomae]RNF75597.1 putative histamine N-monooxygenase [Marinomonas rhizomae]